MTAYLSVAALLVIGLYGMVACGHLVRKLMAMNVLQVAVIFFYILLGAKAGGTAPVTRGEPDPRADAYVNPLPHTLMLTAIVVGVSTTGVALALLVRIRRRYGTLEEREVLERMRLRREGGT